MPWNASQQGSLSPSSSLFLSLHLCVFLSLSLPPPSVFLSPSMSSLSPFLSLYLSVSASLCVSVSVSLPLLPLSPSLCFYLSLSLLSLALFLSFSLSFSFLPLIQNDGDECEEVASLGEPKSAKRCFLAFPRVTKVKDMSLHKNCHHASLKIPRKSFWPRLHRLLRHAIEV